MKKKFNVDGMTCAACQGHVFRAVKEISGVEDVNVNLLENNMVCTYDETKVTDTDIINAVSKAGYKAYIKGERKEKEEEKKDHKLLNLILSFSFLIILMYFSMGVMMWHFPAPPVFDMEKCPMGFSLIQFILVLPILFINRGYFVRGFKRLFKGPTMDSLIAVGASFSLGYSLYLLFAIAMDPEDSKMLHMSLYFEAAGMILCFVSLGKYFEGLSKKKTTGALEALMDLSPKEALVLRDGNEITIPASEIKKGEIIILKRGSIIPADGFLKEGSIYADEANITGESMPVYKKMGSKVYSSTIVSSGYAKVEATEVGEDTEFSAILKLVDEASNSKAPISRLADRISSIFVPAIFTIAALVFLFNFLYIYFKNPSYASGAFETAMNYAITVIVIACPCALGLATPVAIMVGTGKGALNGVIIRNAEILENTGHVDTVVFDKTGTITKGVPVVNECTLDKDTLSIVYSMEMKSEHPLARAIVSYAKAENARVVEVTDFKVKEGYGITGSVNGKEYYIGNEKGFDFIKKEEELLKKGNTVLYVTDNECVLGIISIHDEIKETSKDAIRLLTKMNINTVMLTGDNEITAEGVAGEVGIKTVIAGVKPDEKTMEIKKLMEEGHVVAMVGDGVNDAPSLMTADLGIAIGAGSEAARESADIVLVRNDLMDAVNAIRLSKRTVLTIKIGLFWAFFYNLICVFLASGILYHVTKGAFIMKPEYGSIAMSISSVSVVLNALSINLFQMKKSNIVEEKEENKMANVVIGVDGMMCKHCKAHVEEACMKVSGVTSAVASLEDKNVTVEYTGNVSVDDLKKSITDAGYDVMEEQR